VEIKCGDKGVVRYCGSGSLEDSARSTRANDTRYASYHCMKSNPELELRSKVSGNHNVLLNDAGWVSGRW